MSLLNAMMDNFFELEKTPQNFFKIQKAVQEATRKDLELTIFYLMGKFQAQLLKANLK